jgi:hypothetical protein
MKQIVAVCNFVNVLGGKWYEVHVRLLYTESGMKYM